MIIFRHVLDPALRIFYSTLLETGEFVVQHLTGGANLTFAKDGFVASVRDGANRDDDTGGAGTKALVGSQNFV